MKSKPSLSAAHKRLYPALSRIRFLSQLLDNAVRVPGTSFRFGIDPLLGLIPGIGDILSVLISVYIVLEALRFRLPQSVLIQMVTNLLTDTAVGSVPVAGDLFDVAWKANARNLKLLEAHLRNPNPSRAASAVFLVGVVVVLMLLVGAVVAIALGSLRVIQWLLTGT